MFHITRSLRISAEGCQYPLFNQKHHLSHVPRCTAWWLSLKAPRFPPLGGASSVNAPCGAFCSLATPPRNVVATVFVHLPKQPPASPSDEYCLETAALPRQALTGANRARSGCSLQATLLYIATCTRFQLCRWICVACVRLFCIFFLWTSEMLFFSCQGCARGKKKVASHSLLPRFMRVCVCVRACENAYPLCDVR